MLTHKTERSAMSPLRTPLVWAFIVLACLGALATAFGYLGGFLDPDGNARNMPLALVNEDQGAVLGQRLDFGTQVAAQIRAPSPALGSKVKWTLLPSRKEALDGIAHDRYFAALVIPADFSQRLVRIGEPTSQQPIAAQIEVLANPASGSYAGTFSQTVATTAVNTVSQLASARLADALTAAKIKLTPAAARVLGQPVEATVTIAHPIGRNTGRGIAPFYFAVVLTLAGIIGATIAGTAVDIAAGRVSLDLLGHEVRRPHLETTAHALWRNKLGATLVIAVASGWLITWMAVGLLGMQVANVWALGTFATLAVTMSSMITLTLLIAFGIAGELLAVFFTTIFGVPSAGGVYPPQALPPFFRFLHGWLPLRYVTDGARALIFFNGADVGLRRAAWVLAGYAVAALALGALAARPGRNATSSNVEPRPGDPGHGSRQPALS
jgi:YhgE/Pip-like protein